MPLPSSRSEHSPQRDRRGEPAAEPYGHQLIRPKRFVIPHPLVALLGLAGVIVIYRLGQARGYESMLDYAPWLVGFLVIFSYISRKSARNQTLRRQQELERLRKQPVWNLDDSSEDDASADGGARGSQKD